MSWGCGSIKVLLDLVGPATTKYLLFSGDLLTAEQAELKGLVDRVVDDPAAEAVAFAEPMGSRSQRTTRWGKKTVNPLVAGADADAAARSRYQETIASGELAEGIEAFTRKRSPDFPWHSG